MIKLGINYTSYKAHPMTAERFIRLHSDLRMDIVDWHTGAFKGADKQELLRLKKLALKLGLPMGYMGVGGSFLRVTDQPDPQIEQCKSAIDLSAFLGIPVIRVFGAVPPAGWSLDRTFEGLAKGLREAADYGAEKGVVVALQNHNHGNIASTGDNIVQILEMTDHPNVSFVLDTAQWADTIGDQGHPDRYDPDIDFYAYIEQTLPYACWVRAKIFEVASGVEKALDYDRIFGILKAGEYNGSISIVYEGYEKDDRTELVTKSAAHLRDLQKKHDL